MTMNAILAGGVVFLAIGLGVQAYGLAQLSQCAYGPSAKTACGGVEVLANSISIFLILVGLVAVVRTVQSRKTGNSPMTSVGSR